MTRGRPSKGPRDAILIRPGAELAALLRREGHQNSMTAGEHAICLLARHFEMPHFAPEPSLRHPERHAARARITDDRVTIVVRPPMEFGRLIKECARIADRNYGAYVVAILERVLSGRDLRL